MRFAHVADLHFGREHAGAITEAAVFIRHNNIDALIISGDVTQRGKREEFQAAVAWIEAINLPTLCVPGNHDTPLLNIATRVSEPFGRFEKYLGKYNANLTMQGVSIRGLNTARGWQARMNWAEGSVNMEALSIATQPNADECFSMIACHHPFIQPAGIEMLTQTQRGDEASRRLAVSPVSVLLTGHVHTPCAEVIEEEGGRYLAITAGTLSTRLRQDAPSFNVIEVLKDKLCLSVQSFDDGKFLQVHYAEWNVKHLELISEARVT